MVVMEPKDERELQMMMELALEHEDPSRWLSKGERIFDKPESTFKIGEWRLLRKEKMWQSSSGNTVYTALSAAVKLRKNGVSTMVINARFVKPWTIAS
jgi:1-deoxy-D-xylulose-5-phosphate synthase